MRCELRRLGRGRRGPVVAHRERELRRRAVDAHGRTGIRRVPRHVRERLLQHAVGRDVELAVLVLAGVRVFGRVRAEGAALRA
jgi:hypothetical protein